MSEAGAGSSPARGPARWGILALSSVFGVGYAPLAPGTFGTLAAIPLWFALRQLPVWGFALATLALTGLAIAAAGAAERIYGRHDVGHIVIDEVVGLLATAIGVPFAWPEVVAAFILFRLLDIAKPPPVGWIDRRVPGGLGVVLDDLAAGLIGCGLLHLARVVLGGWW